MTMTSLKWNNIAGSGSEIDQGTTETEGCTMLPDIIERLMGLQEQQDWQRHNEWRREYGFPEISLEEHSRLERTPLEDHEAFMDSFYATVRQGRGKARKTCPPAPIEPTGGGWLVKSEVASTASITQIAV